MGHNISLTNFLSFFLSLPFDNPNLMLMKTDLLFTEKTFYKDKIFLLSFLMLFSLFANCRVGAQEIIPPQCYGGNRLLRQFIAEEMQYPEAALQAKTEGLVVLNFVVEANGAVSNLNISQNVSDEIDAEALRIFKKILWHPATELGKPISSRHELRIGFKIKKYQKMVKKRGYAKLNFPHQPFDTGYVVYQGKQLDVGAYPLISSIDRNLSGFLNHRLKYPEAAFKQSISGKVKLRFVVEPTGHISNIEVVENLGGGCTEEAIRVVKLIQWYPALKGKLAVRSFVPMEINFNLATKTVGGSVPSPGQLN